MRDHTIGMTPEERAAGERLAQSFRRSQILVNGSDLNAHLSADRLAKRRARAKAAKQSRKVNRR